MKFTFDFISPYAYLAAMKVEEFGEVEWCPVLFAAMLNHNGQKGPIEIPSKRLYTFKNVIRTAHDHGIPIQPPPSHPFNPLLALRLVTLHPRPDWIKKLFCAVWDGGSGIESREAIAQVLPEAVEHFDEAESPENKARLKANTEQAIQRQVFGVPSLEIGEEVFWGFDAFPHARRYLAGADPVEAETFQRWLHVQPTAQRQKS